MEKETNSNLLEENKKMRQENLKEGIIILNGEFDDASMENIYFKLEKLKDDKNIEEIKIYINSNGGQVNALFPLIDLIDSLKGKKMVHTIILGKAYSCGVILSMCGHKRSAHKRSEILIHEVSGGFEGTNTQIQLDAIRMKEINKELCKIIKEKTKMKIVDIDKYLNSSVDKFMTAEQALNFGIIDQII